jgi:hypothetical protein
MVIILNLHYIIVVERWNQVYRRMGLKQETWVWSLEGEFCNQIKWKMDSWCLLGFSMCYSNPLWQIVCQDSHNH